MRLFYRGQFGFKIVPVGFPTANGFFHSGWVAFQPDYSEHGESRALRRWSRLDSDSEEDS